VIGTVCENNLFTEHRIMVPPQISGRISYIAERGNYTLDDVVMELENERNPNKPVKIRMSHFWPVRKPRPVLQKLSGKEPLITG